ncbi:hypothetical protein AMTR_s00044p00105690 [Amborella trichopoda]|uniref:Uncharacterized protein n=1 Tax=Amborella trichopoda TaxID=13333 RepID=U5D6S2_AMBTC|nr:hypothetical protein AMTR_s00044p00105690 [Amborella trichopoda]
MDTWWSVNVTQKSGNSWAFWHRHCWSPAIIILDSWHPGTITQQSGDCILGFIDTPAQSPRQSGDILPGFMASRQSHRGGPAVFTLANISPAIVLSSPAISSNSLAFLYPGIIY